MKMDCRPDGRGHFLPLSRHWCLAGNFPSAGEENDLYRLTDGRLARFQPLLPTDSRGKPQVDGRRVIGGIVHVIRYWTALKGCAVCLHAMKTLYDKRFRRWVERACFSVSSQNWQQNVHAMAQ